MRRVDEFYYERAQLFTTGLEMTGEWVMLLKLMFYRADDVSFVPTEVSVPKADFPLGNHSYKSKTTIFRCRIGI